MKDDDSNVIRERPPYSVFAWDLFALLPPERWYAEALDYIACGVHLFEEMAADQFEASWPRAKAAGFLYAHGLELFLKASIAQAGRKIPRTHDLKALARRFYEILPEDVFPLGDVITSFIAANENLPFATFLKYPEKIGDIGKKWDGSSYMDLKAWAANTKRAQAQVEWLWSVVTTVYKRDIEAWKGKVDVELE